MVDARQALQTREAAAATAWVVYQRNVRNLSLMALCALAAAAPIRREDGSYDPEGGLGRPLAKSTAHRWLMDARDQFRDEYVKRPILDMLMEEDDRLENLAAKHAVTMDSFEPGTKGWFEASDRYLRTLESRRKLLGIDRPQQVEVRVEQTDHDDPASTKLKAAMAEAKARRDALLDAARETGE